MSDSLMRVQLWPIFFAKTDATKVMETKPADVAFGRDVNAGDAMHAT